MKIHFLFKFEKASPTSIKQKRKICNYKFSVQKVWYLSAAISHRLNNIINNSFGMEGQKLIVRLLFVSLILCSFTFSCKISDKKVLLDLWEQQEVAVIAENNNVLLYKKAPESWLLSHQVKIEGKVIQAQLRQKTLALVDDQNTLTLLQKVDQEKYEVSLKTYIPTLQKFSMNEKHIIGWTQGKELAILHLNHHDENVKTFKFPEQQILDAQICQNSKVVLRSLTSFYSFDIQSSSLQKQIRGFDGELKNWRVDKDCSELFALQNDSILSTKIQPENQENNMTKKIMILTERDLKNLQVNSDGSLLTVQNEEKVFVYETNDYKLTLIKIINKEDEENVSKICQESLMIKSGKKIFQIEIISEKKTFFEQSQEHERILVVDFLTPQFEQKQNLSFEEPSRLVSGSEALGLYIENGHILIGEHSNLLLYVYNGSQFVQKFNNNAPGITIYSAELDAEREWLFKGDSEKKVTMYTKEGEIYTEKNVFTFESASHMISIDVNSNGYLAAASYSEVYILKWDGETFNSVQNITRSPHGYGIKMCRDNTLLFTIQKNFYVYRNTSSTYQMAQNLSLQMPGDYAHITANDECNVVLLSLYQGGQNSKFIIYLKNQTSTLYEQFQEQDTTNSYYHKAAINSQGDMFVLPGTRGVDVWRYSHQDSNYVLARNYDFYGMAGRNRYSASIDDEYIVYEGGGSDTSTTNDDGIFIARYTWSSDVDASTSFGNKDELVINELENPIQLPRQVTDLAIAGDRVLAVSKYSGAFLHSRSGDDYSEEKSFTESRFFSSLDMEGELGLVVLGSYSRQVHVHHDTGSGFTSVQNISTTSQVLKVSVSGEAGKLLVGTMSGDLISYSWDSQTYFTQDSTISNLGARVYGLKACNDGSLLALLEVFGWFVFKAYDADGIVTFDEDLEQFMEVQMAATDDCSTVVFSNTLLMQVLVYRKSEGNFAPFRTISEYYPLSAISIHPDGDMFVVARHTQSSSALYKFNECTDEFEAEVLEGTMDHYATAITTSQIALGSTDGSIQLFDYQHGLKTCDSFGKKVLDPITSLDSVATERAITAVTISAQLVAFVSLYNGFSLYFNNAGTIEEVNSFPDHHFISSITVQSSLRTLVVGSYQNRVLVYKDTGSGFELNETISTESQVLHVDLSQENNLVVGMMNGDVAEYTSDGESFENNPPSNTTHPGSRVYGVKACGEGKKVVVVETQGVFKVVLYASDWSSLGEITTHLDGELIEPHLATTPNCQLIAVSGITLSKVHVFTDSFAQAFHTLNVNEPISSIAINPDGDLIVVAMITSEKSLLYQYQTCSEGYNRKEDLPSGSYDEAVGVSGNLLVQGNEDGTVKISKYSWVYDPTCPAAVSLPTRVKSEETPSKKLSSMTPPNNGGLNDVELLLLIGGCIVFLLSSYVLVFWIFNQNAPTRKKAEEDSGTQAEMKVEQQV